jgi:predicted outer membrane protein
MAHVNPIQIQKFLKGVDYPASKAELLEKAESLGADENVRASLEQLPDEEYQTPADVSQAFGRIPDGEPGQAAGKEQEKGRKHEPPRAEARDKEQPRAEARDKEQPQAQARDKEQPRAHGRAGEQPRYTGSHEFLIEAMQDTMAEIRVCELAMEKSTNHDVKTFAQKMIDEHGRFGRDLEQLAKEKQVEVPREVRREQKMTVDELSSLSGGIFEQRWIQYNIDVHERDIKVFHHYAGEEPDEDIRAMAKHAGDMMAKHLKLAHELGKKLAKA